MADPNVNQEEARRQAEKAARERGAGYAGAVGGVSPEDARQRAEALEQARREARETAIKKLDEDDKARQDHAVEIENWRARSKPTPTPRESDLAKLGLLDIDSKEDDGSGPDIPPYNIRRSAALTGQQNEPYKTREAQPKK